MKNNEDEWYVFKKTYTDEIFFRKHTAWPLRIFIENSLDVQQLLEDGYIELLPNKKEGKITDLGLNPDFEYTMEHLEQDMKGVKDIYEKKTGKKYDTDDENDIQSVTPLTKSQASFLSDFKNISRLEALPTGDYARTEIVGDPTKHIIYYEDGVLTTENGLGVKTRYVKGFLELRMENLKDELKQVIIELDEAPYELKERLIEGVTKIIDEYVEEKEETNDF